MKISEQTYQQIERFLRQIVEKYPASEEASKMTDIHIRLLQDTGDLIAFNDDEEEITRCIVEQWIGYSEDNFYNEVASLVKKCIDKQKKSIEGMSILKPFSIVLEDDDKEVIEELFLVDDDTVIIDPDLMEGLDEDLNNFLKNLLKN